MARVIFMGTPDFSVPSLLALVEQHEVVGVVTQPDRPAGRGRTIAPSRVKEVALSRGLPVSQPATLRAPQAVDWLADRHPDAIVVAAFGQLLPVTVLDLPAHGCLNVHASLLPRFRGAAPISAALLSGDPATGVTIMRMDAGMDTGPLLAQAEMPIAPDDTTASLTVRLADQGAQLLVETLAGWLSGKVTAQPQDESLVTYCRPLKKEDGLLDWTRPAADLDRQVRACDPWPGTWTTWQGRILKILGARPWPECAGVGQPGQVVTMADGVGVVTGVGLLELLEVQLAGKRPLVASEFARGQRAILGSRLGF